jgi:hypothetical protein
MARHPCLLSRLIGLLILVLVAEAVFLRGWVVQSQEPAGCANMTCKQILYSLNCNTQKGTAYNLSDCVVCNLQAGRCNGGVQLPCVPTDTPLKIAPVDVTAVCLCGQGNPPSTQVEATAKYSGPYFDSMTMRFICQQGGGGGGS